MAVVERYHWFISPEVLHSFFLEWYTSIQDAYAEAQGTILGIVETIDKVHTTNVALQNFLSAVAIGLSFVISIPNFAKFDMGAFRAASVLNNAIQQYPPLGKALFPMGIEDSKQYQVADLNAMLLNQTISLLY